MTFRLSLQKKFVYAFLAGSLVTVLLFSLVIKWIMNDYFQRLGEVRLQFVAEQGQREVNTNVAIFKDEFQRILDGMASTVGALGLSGAIGDRLPRTQTERDAMAEVLRKVQHETRLSMITIVDIEGRTILRATNPPVYGDDVLMRDHEGRPVSSVRRLLLNALTGKTIKSFETFAPEILAKENYIKDGKVVSTLKEHATLLLKTWRRQAPPNTYEDRGLIMTVAMPVRTSAGKIVGAVIGGRLLNKDLEIVTDIQKLLGDRASIFLGDVRVSTTFNLDAGDHKGEIAVGTLLDEQFDSVLTKGELYNFRSPRQMGRYEPLRNYENQVIGAIWIGRPLSFLDRIDRAQREVETGAGRRTNVFIIVSAVISMLMAIGIASFFSRRVTGRIDHLRRGAEVISQGRLAYRLRIESGDEIELLSKQFNSMASKLEESYQTLEKKVEERTHELKESQEVMVHQEKMVGIGQLAAGIAHELNTPLGTIIGYGQMLREDLAQRPDSASNLADVEEIIGEAGRCRDLVKNLLNFARRSSSEKIEADINDIVRRILSLVEHDFQLKGVRVHLNLDPKAPRTSVNENEIAQVILNLANNAGDSMPSGGDLYVSSSYNEDTDMIRIEVRDTGCGIKESDRNRIFEPFFTTKEVGKGTGLGLSICYKIVENHLGSIEFDTVTGEGTTFRVYLPVHSGVRVV